MPKAVDVGTARVRAGLPPLAPGAADTLCAHTFSVRRRQLVRLMLREAGVSIDNGDPFVWGTALWEHRVTRTIYFTATTLDGYIADERDSLEWLFVHDIDAAGPNSHEEFMGGVGAIVMGRTTDEWVREHLQGAHDKWPFALPSWVFTRASLPGIDGADIRFAEGAVARRSTRGFLRPRGSKDVWVVGGGDLAGQFADGRLLDQLIVSIAPVTLGPAVPLSPPVRAGTGGTSAESCVRLRNL